MSQEPIPLTTASARKTLRGSSRLILAFLAASLAAHAAFIVALPEFFHAASPARMSVLEVTVLKPEPLPAATVPLEAMPRQQRAGQKSRKSQAPLTAAREPSAPVLSLPRPEPAAQSSFAIAPAAGALLDAVATLGGTRAGAVVTFDPPLDGDAACTATQSLTVPVKSKLKLKAEAVGPSTDPDSLTLVCRP